MRFGIAVLVFAHSAFCARLIFLRAAALMVCLPRFKPLAVKLANAALRTDRRHRGHLRAISEDENDLDEMEARTGRIAGLAAQSKKRILRRLVRMLGKSGSC